jgi:hypothetical protein
MMDPMDDRTLVERFEARTLSSHELGHREHLRVAFAMLAGADLGDAAVRFRRGLRAYVASVGAGAKYHETLTWAFLIVVHERMADHADGSSAAFLARNPDLLDPARALRRHYDVAALIASPLARRVFVLPERS